MIFLLLWTDSYLFVNARHVLCNSWKFSQARFGHGFKFAPVLGEILADMIEGNAPAYDVTMFSPSRFI